MIDSTGFCGEAHNLAYCSQALDRKLRDVSGLGSVMERVFEAKDGEMMRRKRWKEENPGKQLRFK